METQNVVALASTGLAAIVAVGVPWVTFRFALRQEHVRWLREQRARLYSDMLTEAYAEQRWFEHRIADEGAREAMQFHDLRLPPAERASLGARGTMLGSAEVNRLFNQLQAVMFETTMGGPRHEGDRVVARVRLASVMEELQAAVRRELESDQPLGRSLPVRFTWPGRR